MSHRVTRRARIGTLALVVLAVLDVAVGQQTKSFIPVEGATLKAKIDGAIAAGKANAAGGRFWVAYQFEVRPGVAVDFEIVDSAGGVYISSDGTSMMLDPRNETRELGLCRLNPASRQILEVERVGLRRPWQPQGVRDDVNDVLVPLHAAVDDDEA